MAISEDTGNQPVAVHNAGVSPATTASFSPQAGTLLVAMTAMNGPTGTPITATISDSLAGGWTLLKRQNTSTSMGGSAEIWCRYLAAAPGAMTVTSTWTGADTGGSLVVRSLLGASSTQNGATAGVGGASIAPNTTLTPTQIGSWIYGALLDWSAATAMTANANTSIIDQFNDATNGDTYAALKAASASAALSSTSYGCTTANAAYNVAFAEILASTSLVVGARVGTMQFPGHGPFPRQRTHNYTRSPLSTTSGDVVVTADVAQGFGNAFGTADRPFTLLAMYGGSSGGPGITALADVALGTGTASDASVSTTTSGTTANADVALGTGTAFGPVVDVGALPALAAGTGVSSQPVIDIGSLPDIAQGTGTSSQPMTDVGSAPGLAAGTGAALTDSTIDVVLLAVDVAQASGSAFTAVPDTGASPSTATGTGVAQDATSDVGAVPGTAAGTGTAQADPVGIVVLPDFAAGAGTAFDAVTSTSGSTTVTADIAAGTGTAFDAVTDVGAFPVTANATGAVLAASQDVGGLPATATGSGLAQDASASVGALPGLAAGTGTSSDVVTDVGAAPVLASGTGSVLAPSMDVVVLGTGLAAGTGTAGDVPADVGAAPSLAAGTGSALGALTGITVIPDVAIATGSSFDAAVTLPQAGAPTVISGREGNSLISGREASTSLRGQDSGMIYGRETLSSTSGTEPDNTTSGQEP
jgi:hypothetical protein